METIVLGPGSIDQAHQPNEYIPLNQLEPTIDIIRHLIIKYCCDE
jgi:acetylornithine deacetylase